MNIDAPSTAPTPADLFGRLEAVASRAPDNVAIVAADRPLTFAELVGKATSFSAELAKAGVQPRDRVAVILPNGWEFVVAAFAIWKRGAILTPLHAQLSELELMRYIAECSARAVVMTEAMGAVANAALEDAGGTVAHAWLCPKDADAWTYRPGRQGHGGTGGGSTGDPVLDDGWPALTQFSTGSTGRPKQITRSHGQLIGEFEAVSEVLARTEQDRVLGVAPFFHSHGLMNAAVGALLAGARLYAVEKFFPRDIAQLIERERITGFPGGPFMFQLLAEMRESATLSSLRYIVSAGAPLPDAVAAAFKARYGVSIRELFGSTETGVITIERADQDKSGEHSVGLPIPGVTLRIVDADGQSAPTGEKGRVEVTTPHAATRYDQSEEQTEAHFVGPHFYPGDLGRLMPDGRLVLLGRDRGFINVAGNKADPVEVEVRAAWDARDRRGRGAGPSRRCRGREDQSRARRVIALQPRGDTRALREKARALQGPARHRVPQGAATKSDGKDLAEVSAGRAWGRVNGPGYARRSGVEQSDGTG